MRCSEVMTWLSEWIDYLAPHAHKSRESEKFRTVHNLKDSIIWPMSFLLNRGTKGDPVPLSKSLRWAHGEVRPWLNSHFIFIQWEQFAKTIWPSRTSLRTTGIVYKLADSLPILKGKSVSPGCHGNSSSYSQPGDGIYKRQPAQTGVSLIKTTF